VGAVSLAPLGRLMPRWDELKACVGTMLRATGVGFFLGLLPGCAPGAISFISYDIEKRVSKTPERFGHGAIEGVAAPEGANNATTSGGFVPLFALGIPATPALAVLLSGLMIYGLQPGPLLFEKQPLFVWTVIASMYIGNVMLLILNLPLVGLWARMVRIPYAVMAPLILIFSVLGVRPSRRAGWSRSAARAVPAPRARRRRGPAGARRRAGAAAPPGPRRQGGGPRTRPGPPLRRRAPRARPPPAPRLPLARTSC